MSEQLNQDRHADPIEDDPLAELARIVAGESPLSAPPQNPPVQAVTEGARAPDALADGQIGFGAGIEQELLKEIEPQQSLPQEMQPPIQQNPAPAPAAIPAPAVEQDIVQAMREEIPALHEEIPPSIGESGASLEDQLMKELSIAEPMISPPPVHPDQLTGRTVEPFVTAETTSAGMAGLQQVEALAEELAIEAAPAPTPTPQAENPFVPQQEFVATVPAETIPEAISEAGLQADVYGSDVSLEAEFESAFASELNLNSLPIDSVDIQADNPVVNEIPPAPSWQETDTNEAQLEFSAAFPGENAGLSGNLDISGAPMGSPGPEHLNDPTMLDEAGLDDGLGEPLSRRPKRNGFKMAALALGIALFAGFGAVGYGYFTNSETNTDPILVKADTGAIKVKPEDSGGKLIANQDKAAYAELSGEKEQSNQARLVSGTEVANGATRQINAIEPKAEERLSPSAEENNSSVPAAIAPRRVRTFTVKPDGTIIIPDPVTAEEPAVLALQAENTPLEVPTDTAEIAAIEPGAPLFNPVVPETNEVAAIEVDASSENVNIGPEAIDGAIAATGNIAIPEQSPLPKPAKLTTKLALIEAVAKPEPDNNAGVQLVNTSSPWAVQISSQRSREAADASFKNLQKKFPSLLSGQSVDIRQAQITGKGTFFRVRVQAGSKQAATSFCTRFKSSGGSCFVTR